MDNKLNELNNMLTNAGLSVTMPRKTVFNALLNSEPISMSSLIEKIGGKIDRASIYRSMAVFEKLGIVNRIQTGWKYKIELSDLFSIHHHHMSCVICNSIEVFEESAELRSELNSLTRQAGFKETDHQLEIRGICINCRQNVVET